MYDNVFVNYRALCKNKWFLLPKEKIYMLIKFKLLKMSNSLAIVAFDGTKVKG